MTKMYRIVFSMMIVALIMTTFAGQIFAEKSKIVWAVGSTTRLPIYEGIAKQYMAEHPDVEISTLVPTSYYETLKTWMASGVQIDIMWLGQNLLSFGDLLLPLDDVLAKDKNVKTIHQNALKTARWDGHQIGLPFGINTNVIFYNKQMFDTAGVAKPVDNWTIPDLIADGKKITKDTNGDGKSDVWAICPLTYYQAVVQGGDFYSADGRKAIFVNPVSIEATQFVSDLNNGVLGIAYPQVPSAQREPMFYDAKTAMYQGGTFWTPTVRQKVNFDWDLVPFPGLVKDGKRYDSTFVSLESWAVAKTTKDAALTKEFLAYLYSAEAIKPLVNMGTIIPSQPQHWASYLSQAAPPSNLYAFMKSVDYAHIFEFDHVIGSYVGSSIMHTSNTMYKNMIGGKIPAAIALPELQNLVNAYLDEYWAKRDSGK